MDNGANVAAFQQSDLRFLPELQPAGWTDISTPFRYYISQPFCIPVKVLVSGVPVGIGCGIALGATGWLAHIIVHTDYRNRGIGGLIVDHLVSRLLASGCESISLIATSLGFPVYRKRGFREQAEYVVLKRDASVPRPCAATSPNIGTCGDSERDCILRLDAEVSGETRGAVLDDNLAGAYVYRDESGVTGFYMPDLGEGLVVAESAQAGIELARLRLSRADGANLPVANERGVRFLLDMGLTEVNRVKRMVLGKPYPFKPERIFNRIAGNLG